MKDMTYQRERNLEIIAQGTHKGFSYWVFSMGTHPCAYVEVTSISDQLGKEPRLMCHGGVTYDEDDLVNVWDEAFEGFEPGARRFVGWDYAHLRDYYEHPSACVSAYLNTLEGGHKWTTEEIVTDVKDTIDSMVSPASGRTEG